MKKLMLMALVVALAGVAWAGSPALTNPNAITTDVSPIPGAPGVFAPGDSIWGFDSQTGPNDNQCLGVEWVPLTDKIYVTGANTGVDPNRVYVYNHNGTYLRQWNQPAASTGWGGRDLAWDGRYLAHGTGSGTTIYLCDTAGTYLARTITGPQNPIRGLAFDPATRTYWTAGFATTIQNFDSAGTVLSTTASTKNTYGMAWDTITVGGPWLWVYSQDGTPACQASQFNPRTRVYTGVAYQLTMGNIAGGASFSGHWGDAMGKYGLFCLDQALVVDRVILMELGNLGAAPANDMSMQTVIGPRGMVSPGATVTPEGRALNAGTANQTSVPCVAWIDSAGTRIYTGAATIGSINAGDTARVQFSPTWTSGPAGITYNVTMFTNLAADARRTNDTTRANVMTFQVVTSLAAPRGTAPTIDGNIQTSEWADANRYDVSDVLGNGGGNPGGSPPGTCYLYLKNDSTNLYFGVDNNFGSLADYDQLGLYFDDNNNDAWQPDTSEGNFWWAYLAAGNRTIWRGWLPGPVTAPLVEPVPGMVWAVAVQGGRHHYEGNVQIGPKPPNANYFLNAALGSTVGFYMYSQFNGAVQRGWWPTAMPNAGFSNPAVYGDLVLLRSSGVEAGEPVKAPARAALYAVTPNPVKGMGIVRFALPAKSDFSLKLYDVQGRLVRTLAAGTREAGVHNVGLSGEGLAKGVYFYRLQAGAFSATRSLVVVR